MKVIHIFIAIIVLAVTQLTMAQKAEQLKFSSNPQEFYPQLQAFIEKTNRPETKKITELFITNCTNGIIKAERVAQIIELSNIMLDKKMRTYPHFNDYLLSLNNMVASGNMDRHWNDWHAIVKDLATKISKGNYNRFENFIDFSNGFFNGKNLHKSSGKTWKAFVPAFNFIYKNDTVILSIPEGSLYGVSAKDSLAIIDTKGDYYVFESVWKGKKGKVTWERCGLDPNKVYADIPAYKIDFTKTSYTVEDATFYNKEYFTRPLKGSISDQISSKIEGEYIYPQFRSYETDLRMTNVAPQVEYLGGFGMDGAKLVGWGKPDAKATLNFFSAEKKLILKANSLKFGMKPGNEINSTGTTIALYFGNDSIYHPNLNLKYSVADHDLRLVRDNKASAQIAFISSYHKIEANVDGVFWKTNTPIINFKMVSQLKDLKVIFESFNFYDEQRLKEYTKVTDVDFVSKLKIYADNGQYQVPAIDFAKFLNDKYSVESILSGIFDMVKDGFIYYDADKQIITIRQKLVDNQLARTGKIDYDRIVLISQTNQIDQENAQLDLLNKELLVAGIKKIGVSDSQNVTLYPHKGLVRVQQNRDMKLAGTIVAGSVDFAGKGFKFNYEPFTVKMDSVEQMQIYLNDVKDKDAPKLEGTTLTPVQSIIQNVSGTLFIDKETNKSGLKKYPSYPRFESNGNAFVYYDSKKLYDGAYKRDTFYFKLNPFEFTDLDEITPDLMHFPGTMVTGNIFPKTEQTLTLQDDYSLGFQYNTSASGLTTYGKGNYTGKLTMSNKGLKGDGNIEYMAANMSSKEFTFVPDSTFAAVDTFYTQRKTVKGYEFPNSHNSNVKIKWIPGIDSMMVQMTKRPFAMYDDNVSMKGTFVLTDKGMKGMGTMTLSDAALRSSNFSYKSGSFTADSADVQIKNQQVAKVAFNSYNVKAKVDMDKWQGDFAANGANIPILLPFNQYKTTAQEFYWLMKDKIVNIRMPEDGSGYFESTHPDQGKLKYSASGAVVNLADNTIQVDGIPYITVADANIQPENTQAIILGDAKLKTLVNATLICDTAKQFHTISNGTFDIKSINEFTGKGEYKFKAKGLKKQTIQFDLISSKQDSTQKNNPYFTYASTQIPENQDFKLSSNISYKGNVALDSRKQFLVFDGFCKIQLNTEGIDNQYFKFTSEINPDNISIDVSTPVGERKDTLMFGVLMDMDALSLYSAFLTKKRTSLDVPLFKATGELNFDSDNDIYKVSTKDKLAGKPGAQGAMFILDDKNSFVKAQGLFTLVQDVGLVTIKSAGEMENNLKTGTFKANDVVLGIDFLFDKKLLESIGETIRRYNTEKGEVDYTKPSFLRTANEIVDKKQTDNLEKMIKQYNYMPEKVKGLDQPIVLCNVQMIWDTAYHTFKSVGKFGLSFMGEKYVNRMVDGYLEFGSRQKADFFNLYFETDKDEGGVKQWYYFHYKKGVMSVLSSDLAFNQSINSISEKKRIKEDKKAGLVYKYELAPMQMRNTFLSNMKGGATIDDILPELPKTEPAPEKGKGKKTKEEEQQPIENNTQPVTPPPTFEKPAEQPTNTTPPAFETPDSTPTPPNNNQEEEEGKKKKKGKKKKNEESTPENNNGNN